MVNNFFTQVNILFKIILNLHVENIKLTINQLNIPSEKRMVMTGAFK
jgi:hypothetical protein